MTLRRRSQGFTLIELMIVVSIIGILSTIAIPQFNNALVRSKEVATMTSKEIVKQALFAAYADTGQWPSGYWVCIAPLGTVCNGPTGNYSPDAGVMSAISAYLPNPPTMNAAVNSVCNYVLYCGGAACGGGAWLFWPMQPNSPDRDCLQYGGGSYIQDGRQGPYRYCVEEFSSS